MSSGNKTGFDQDDAAGLAAERAIDDQLLGKRMLLEDAACVQTNTPFRCSHPRSPSTPALGSRAAPAHSFEPAIFTPAVPAQQRRLKSAYCARRPLPAIPAEDNSPPSQLCRRGSGCGAAPRLLLLCLSAVVPDKPPRCTPVVGPLSSESTAPTLLRFRRRPAYSLQRRTPWPAYHRLLSCSTALLRPQPLSTLRLA